MTNTFNPVVIAEAVEKLNIRMIYQADGSKFGARFFNSTCRFFSKEKAAKAIEVPAMLLLNCHAYDGFVTIGRDGSLQVRRSH